MSEYHSGQDNDAHPLDEEYLQRIIKENQGNDGTFLERLMAAHDEVIAEFSKYWKQLVWNAPSMIDGFKGFVKDIDWSERWIQGIVAVQACVLLTLILFRNNMAVQNIIFLASVGIIYYADKLNAWGAEHWEEFSRHNYFHPDGAFISLVVSAPLLLGMLIVLTNYAVHFMWTLVYMKKEQLKQRARVAGHQTKKQKQQAPRGSSQEKKRK